MRFYYTNSIREFVTQTFCEIWSQLTAIDHGNLLQTQKQAWELQIDILKNHLTNFQGNIYFEYSIPRLGKRIDAVVLIQGVIFVFEFKVGAKEYNNADINQVWDYALDLKYFHEESHTQPIVPILVATKAKCNEINIISQDDLVVQPILTNGENLDISSNKHSNSIHPILPIIIYGALVGMPQPRPLLKRHKHSTKITLCRRFQGLMPTIYPSQAITFFV